MQHKLFLIIIGIVFWAVLGTNSNAAFSAEQIRPLVTKYKKLITQKEAAENESGLQSIEKIIRLEEEIEHLSTRIRSIIPDWQGNAETSFGLNDIPSTFETRISQKNKSAMPKKLSEQEHKTFLTKEMTELRTKMLDQQDQIAKAKNSKERVELQQVLRSMGQKLNVLREALGDNASTKRTSAAINTPQSFMDRKNADRDHENFLQDQLQDIYEKIYILREKSLEEQSGAALKSIGNEITELENEELTLTRRLLAIGVKPLPPKILDKSTPKTPQKQKVKTEVVEYQEDLTKRIQEVKEEIQFLQGMKKKVTSGAAMAELGLQISRRESEINLLQETLSQISPKPIPPPKQKSPSKQGSSRQTQVKPAEREKSQSTSTDQPFGQGTGTVFLLEGPAMHPSERSLWQTDYNPQATNLTPEGSLNQQTRQRVQAINLMGLIDNASTSGQPIPPSPYTRNTPQNPQNSMIFQPPHTWGGGLG